MVSATDLGPNETKWNSAAPTIVGEDVLGRFATMNPERATYATQGVIRAAELLFLPLYSQYKRRSTLDSKSLVDTAWKNDEPVFVPEQANDRSGGFFEFAMKIKTAPLVLQATDRGDEGGGDFDILVDDVKIATQHLEADKPSEGLDVEYLLPLALNKDQASESIRFVLHEWSARPVFGVRLFTAKPGSIG